MSITTASSTTCPTWCEQHSTEEGITYHEANVDGGPWDLILTHEATTEGTSVSVGLKRDPLTPSEAFALGVALIEAATTIGLAEVQRGLPTEVTVATVECSPGVPVGGSPFADLLASELRRGGWNLSRMTTNARTLITPVTVPSLERVRRTYAYGDNQTPEGFHAAGVAFDAWLAAHDAELLGRHGQGVTR